MRPHVHDKLPLKCHFGIVHQNDKNLCPSWEVKTQFSIGMEITSGN